mgnify:CR=1 FL=1
MKCILTNYNVRPDWIFDYTDDFLIYDRSDSLEYLSGFPVEKIKRVKNWGNADFDKLEYLIENYDNLPEVFLWSKSNLFKFITKEEFEKVKDNKVFTPLLTMNHKVYEPICRYEGSWYMERNDSWYAPQFERKFNTYNDWALYMGLPTPEYLKFAPGGSYILTSDCVRKYPKTFYIKMKETLNHAVLPAEAQYCERSYYTLWQQ